MEDDNRENSTKTTVETDYAAHEENPGPAKVAVEEKNDKGASNVMNWVILLIVVVLVIVYFVFM